MHLYRTTPSLSGQAYVGLIFQVDALNLNLNFSQIYAPTLIFFSKSDTDATNVYDVWWPTYRPYIPS